MTVVPYRNRALIQKVQKNTKEIIEKEASINAKANKVDIDNSLALKANQADVDSGFANVNSALVLKANQTDLALKANQADVDSSFANVNSALTFKADKNGSTNESFSTNLLELHTANGEIAQQSVTNIDLLVTTTDPADPQNPANCTTTVYFTASNINEVTLPYTGEAALLAKDVFLTADGNGPSSLVRKLDQLTPEATTTGVNQTAPVQGNFLFSKFNSIDSQVAARAHVINPTFTNNITVDNKVKVSDFAKIQLQDGSQHLGEFIDNKIKATRPKMRLTKFGGDNMALDWLFSGNSHNGTYDHPHVTQSWIYSGGAHIRGPHLLGYTTELRFGYEVSLSANGNRMAVGVPYANGAKDGNNNYGVGPNRSGAVAIYDWNETTQSWEQRGQTIFGTFADTQLGRAVKLCADGSRFAVAEKHMHTSVKNRGRVHVYLVAPAPAANHLLLQSITSPVTVDYAFFGASIAVNHNLTRIAIGSPFNNQLGGSPGYDSANGKVFVFDDTDPEDETVAWTLIGEFAGSTGDNAGGVFQVAMSLDGTRVAYGAETNDANGTNSGKVTVMQLHGDTGYQTTTDAPQQRWSQIGQILLGDGTDYLFGGFLAFSADGNLLAISSRGYDTPAEPQDPTVVLTEPASPAPAQTNAGRVQVFKYVNDSSSSTGHAANGLTGKNWLQHGQDLEGPHANAYQSPLALSADGSRIAVSNYYHTAQGGRVRVYDYNEERGIWERVGDPRMYNAATRLTFGNSTTVSRFGHSLSMSADGTRLAVGDFWGDPYSHYAGVGRVFTYDRLRNNTLIIKDTLTPRATDLEKSGMDLALGTQTVVNVFNSNGTQLSVNTISLVGNYTVEYISTNSKGESTKLTFNVYKYI